METGEDTVAADLMKDLWRTVGKSDASFSEICAAMTGVLASVIYEEYRVSSVEDAKDILVCTVTNAITYYLERIESREKLSD